MAPGTGTPDYAASSIRERSTCHRGVHISARLPVAVLCIPLLLAGCTTQPLAPETPASPKPGYSAPESTSEAVDSPAATAAIHAARSGDVAPPASVIHPSKPPDPGEIDGLDDSSRQPPESGPATMAADEGDAWERIRNGMNLQYPEKKQVKRAIDWYRKNPAYLDRLAQRARPYLAHIVREVEKHELPMEFALLPVVESAFRERAYSSAGAAGLWQFMPSTGKRYGLKQNWWYDGRRDVVESTRAALDYLTSLMQEFNDDPLLAIAAYNWGEGNVRRAISRNRARGKPTDVWSLRLPRETRTHVYRFVAISRIIEEPDRYGVVLQPIPDQVYFRPVALDGQVELAFAAKLAGISTREIRRLNPGFKRSATAPGGPHRLQLPTDAAQRFTATLARLPTDRDRRWIRHAVVPGDTLGAIATRYGTSVKALKDTNGLASDRIFAGTHLTIPVALGLRGVALADSPAPEHRSVPGTDDTFEPEGPATTIHHVRNGDNLWLIARRHAVDIEQLAAWNDLSVESILMPGQQLTVHHGGSRPLPAALLRTSPQENARANAVHVVQYGDTLSEIAVRRGTTVLALTELNRIEEDAILLPGQELRLNPAAYADLDSGPQRIRYRVKHGDSLWAISRQFGVSVASLRRWNQLSVNDLLFPGRELFVHLSDSPTS